ncbi:hypothetical protein VIMS_00499 [Mycobacterium marinum]|uniref:DUF732 domain-containing protein n=1 Tax=Mycobacterium marinum TaxID=1781 RepID=UPI000E3D5303|nr:DUF732 domain-containing protein [Mycobacterium marinum]RFZ21381.1 hypothetical protein VIMS_00499 [Mycobacterium marinum]
MFTGITSHAEALVAAIVVLTGAAILPSGAAAAEPNQDDQFLALLDKKEIPAIANVPRVIAAAHKVCRKLDSGMPADDLLDGLRNDAYNIDPMMRQEPARLTTTMTRFITAAVQIYCPHHQSKMVSIKASPAPGSNQPTHRVAANTHNAVNSGSDLREPRLELDMTSMPTAWQEPTGIGTVQLPHLLDGGVFVAGHYRDGRSNFDPHDTTLASLIGTVPAGDPLLPNPAIPAPPPPTAQILSPPPPIAAAPSSQPPQELTPPPQPPQEPPPPPQEVAPPADAPSPGGAADSGGIVGNGGGGSGGSGGGGGAPAEPSPGQPMAPGFIGLAP